MFLHLGGETVVPTKDIIAIISLEAKEAVSTHEFLRTADDEGFVVSLSDKPNSFIVTSTKVYLSPISALTLKKRAYDKIS